MGKQWKQWDFIFGGSKVTACSDWNHEIKRHLLLGRKAMTNLDNILKADKLLCQQRSIQLSYGFSSSHVWMWELAYKESWVWKNWWFWTVVLEKTLESPLDSKEIQPVLLKEISPGCSLEGLMTTTFCISKAHCSLPVILSHSEF